MQICWVMIVWGMAAQAGVKKRKRSLAVKGAARVSLSIVVFDSFQENHSSS